jgi:predicted CxxxxCH...CXXCH cytochrome family protein
MITRKYLLIFLGALAAFAVVISCSEDRTPTSSATHPVDWMTPGTDAFHGIAAVNTGGESCLGCHATPTQDGYTAVQCYACHDGYPHLWESRVPGHRDEIRGLDWNLALCSNCHGDDWAGANTGVSCRQCHTQPAGPADCNTCHGQPPVDDDGLPFGYASGASGAHAVHVFEKGYACTECHANISDLSHADAIPAEVNFTEAQIANVHDFEPTYAPPLDIHSGNGGCSSVYCHGGEAVGWLGDPVACGSCHALPPPGPFHGSETRCHICHTHVDPTSNYDIPTTIRFLPELEHLHVNGVVNAIFP